MANSPAHSMRTFYLLATAMLGTTLPSCMPGPRVAGEPELRHDSLPFVNTTATTLTESEALAFPTDVAVVGDYLAVIDIASDSAIHVMDRIDGKLVRSLGRRGEGPGEFEGAWSLDQAGEDQAAFWVYDLALKRLSLVRVEPDGTAPIDPDRLIHFRSASHPTGPVWTNEGTMLSLGLHPNARLAVYDEDGIEIGLIGRPPSDGGDAPASVMQHAYQAVLVPHPERQQVAAITRHASQLEFWSADGSNSRIVQGPLEVTPDLESSAKLSSDAFVMRGTGRIGYVDAAASEEHVYALFSGRTLRGFEQDASFARFVHVFDWNGEFQYALKLETDAVAIAVDRESSTLYALRHDPVPAIDAYALGATPAQTLAAHFD